MTSGKFGQRLLYWSMTALESDLLLPAQHSENHNDNACVFDDSFAKPVSAQSFWLGGGRIAEKFPSVFSIQCDWIIMEIGSSL